MDPEHLTVLTGAGSVIDLLLHCIADPGDAVLIPAPYYPAFDNDLKVCLWSVAFNACVCAIPSICSGAKEEGAGAMHRP